MNPFSLRSRLREVGLLGINERNGSYTLRCNPRRLYPLVDDKLATKRLCAEAGIPTGRVIAVADLQVRVAPFVERLAREDAFVLKPARGAMGNGILVVTGRESDRFRRAGGGLLDTGALRFHASSIVSGLYSLEGRTDVAFAEELLEVHPMFREIATDGVPDVRVLVYRGVPAMAMTRLPTRASRGRANLHQGAVGAGIDLVTGRTLHAVHSNHPCDRHPDTGQKVIDRVVPDFEKAVEIAVRATDATGLGYVGADVVVDGRRGPLILELNARPGLAVQMANRSGLLPRLHAIDAAAPQDLPLERRLVLGREIARVSREHGAAA